MPGLGCHQVQDDQALAAALNQVNEGGLMPHIRLVSEKVLSLGRPLGVARCMLQRIVCSGYDLYLAPKANSRIDS